MYITSFRTRKLGDLIFLFGDLFRVASRCRLPNSISIVFIGFVLVLSHMYEGSSEGLLLGNALEGGWRPPGEHDEGKRTTQGNATVTGCSVCIICICCVRIWWCESVLVISPRVPPA